MTGISDMRGQRRFENAILGALRGPCRAVARCDGGERLEPLIVAVSGGPDSLALLHALAQLCRGPLRSGDALPSLLHVAYFDHGLREEAAVRDERDFVAAQAAVLGLAWTGGRADVRAFAREHHLSLEDAARRCRYSFLGELARGLGVGVVAVGHTASDQAETVLLRLIRGTGVSGLAGMDWRAPWPLPGGGPDLVRPMLGLRREETVQYCRARRLSPRHDATNDSPRYLRNRVRHELLPLLASYTPRIVAALTGLAESSREAHQLITQLVDASWPELARVEGDRVALARASLRQLPPAVRAEALRRAASMLAEQPLPPERVHLRALESLMTGRTGRTVELPGGVRAEAATAELRLWREAAVDGPQRSPPAAGVPEPPEPHDRPEQA